MRRSSRGGQRELSQDFLNHRSVKSSSARPVVANSESILKIRAGVDNLPRALVALSWPFSAIVMDERRVGAVRHSSPRGRIEQSDVLRHPCAVPAIVGSSPFRSVTTILRRFVASGDWWQVILLARRGAVRNRPGVGGCTVITAQTASWSMFDSHGRAPSWSLTPRLSVDGGILAYRETSPLGNGY